MIPYIEHGGSGPRIHFLHANGYPPECYRPLFERLTTQYSVFGMLLRALWPNSIPGELRDWKPLSDDLIRFLNEQDAGRVIGMGHSIGAVVTLRAALNEPDRFRALVLLDPVLFPYYFMLSWNFLRLLGIGRRVHPKIPAALKRRREFDNLEIVFRGYRGREVFQYMDDGSLWAYIKGITKPTADGKFKLAYSPEWEAEIYYTGGWNDWDIWRGISQLRIPTFIIRGAETDTFWESAARKVQKKNRAIRIASLEKSTHLVPLEKPQEVFEVTDSFLKEVL